MSKANRRACASIGLSALLLAVGIAPVAAGPADGDAVYRFSADAVTGFVVAADGLDPFSVDSAAVWTLATNALHRIEAPGWGLVLSHQLDFSGQSATAPSFTPAMTVYEAYARLALGQWAQLFIGKRRMGLGIGTTFAPGDSIDPRTGFWDQKNGFRGVALGAGIGPDVALRAALSLDRNLDAWAAGMRAKANPTAALIASYEAMLDGAAGPADPRLLTAALSADAQLGILQVAVAGSLSPGRVARPSLGVSLDLAGVILQAECAVELEGAPDWHGTAGIRYTWSGDASSLTISVDADFNGAPGLLWHTWYALPYLSYARDEVFNIYARALVELEAPSALLSCGLTLYPAPGLDLELTGLFALGESGEEFGALPGYQSPGSGTLKNAIGLAARMHF